MTQCVHHFLNNYMIHTAINHVFHLIQDKYNSDIEIKQNHYNPTHEMTHCFVVYKHGPHCTEAVFMRTHYSTLYCISLADVYNHFFSLCQSTKH